MTVLKSTFIPLMRVPWFSPDGYTESGRPKMQRRGTVGLSIIKMDTVSERTSIRTDTSGSGSHASTQHLEGRLLIAPNCDVSIGDSLKIHKVDWSIVSVWPRYAMSGQIDHFQVDVERWV